MIPKEVLILPQRALSPSSWTVERAAKLFDSHLDEKVEDAPAAPSYQDYQLGSANLEALWSSKGKGLAAWQDDYSATYAIHAYKSDPNQFSNYRGSTVAYILARQSNLARAVFPALKHAINAGIVSADDKVPFPF
jgi:hypothetical protein